jgi:hypothetical protein
MGKIKSIKMTNFFNFKYGYFIPKNYFNLMFVYNAFFMIGMLYGADDIFGPNSILGMVFFNSFSDERTIFYCRMCGILGLCYSSGNWLFGMDTRKLAKIDLVLNIAFLAVNHDIVFNGLPGATSEWDNQFYVQFVVVAINAAVVVFNTENKKARRKSL